VRVGLTYDLKDDYLALGLGEHEVAEFDCEETIAALEGALTALGHEVERVGHVRALAARLVAGWRCDLVFNIAEGVTGFGRESQVPLVTTAAEAAAVTLPLPLFAKPVAEGSSKGITAKSLVRSRAALVEVCGELLERYRQPVLVEEFLSGREFTVGILGTDGSARALATLEVLLLGGADQGVYSYRNKTQWQGIVDYRLLEAGSLRAEVENVALATWRCLGCRDAGRVDVRLDGNGRAQMIEVNPLAGLMPGYSDLPIMAELTGMSYGALIGEIVRCAVARLDAA